MKKITFITIFLILQTINSQNNNFKFGVKSGINLSKYTPEITIGNLKLADYQNKIGYYVGGYTNISISEKISLQPELLFSTQGTKILIEDVTLINSNGNDIDNGNIKSKINETTISSPIILQYFISDKFNAEGGVQLGYIINRKEEITESPFEQDIGIANDEINYDKIDLGLTFGLGFKVLNNIKLNTRYFFGVIERDNLIKPSILSLGLEYRL